MAFTPYSGQTDYISTLDDLPNDVGGLTAEQLKAMFDRFGSEFVTWFNATHLTELSLKNIGGSNKNLLHNPGLQVNQRGLSSYTSDGYSLDRWKGNNRTVTVNADNVVIAPTAFDNSHYQLIENFDSLVGKTITLSFNITAITGTFTISAFNTGIGTITTTGITSVTFTVPEGVLAVNKFIGIAGNTGSSITFPRGKIASKLEPGSVSTLANDSPADFGEELAKCQRYYEPVEFPTYNYSGGKLISVIYPFKVTKRIASPTFIIADKNGNSGKVSFIKTDYSFVHNIAPTEYSATDKLAQITLVYDQAEYIGFQVGTAFVSADL